MQIHAQQELHATSWENLDTPTRPNSEELAKS